MKKISERECAELAIEELAKIVIIDKNDVLDFHREKVKKDYPAYFDTYSQFEKIKNYLDTISNLWCVGRNGQHRYNNMDHSMLTAIKAVEAIKKGVTSKTDIWNVNTEKTYHEKK